MSRSRPLVTTTWIVVLAAGTASAQMPTDFRSIPGPIIGARAHPGEAVRAWMSQRLQAYGLEDGQDALRLAREEPLPGGATRVLVQQLWHGLPVAGADARAIVSADGRITALISGFERGVNAPLEPHVAPERAGSLAAGAADLAPGAAPEAVTLAVARRADGDHLVWEVAWRRADGEPVHSVIDAVTGEVLDRDAGIAHAVGNVYPTDPRQPLEERELPGLLPGTPLRSIAYEIDDSVDPPVLPGAGGDYRLSPGDPGFDQVNLYWHVAHDFIDFWGGLGYPGPPEPLVVRLHFPLEAEVARTSDNYVTFGKPITGFCLEPTRADDIVYHELGHAVLYGYGIQPGGSNREAIALHEGLADYFAAAFTGDPAIGEWAYLTYPNGVTRVDRPAPPWDYAHYDRVAFGGGGLSSAWANGMILSSGLWDLRQQLGRTCDSLVLEALTYLPEWPTWGQLVDALYFADRDHHGARYWNDIGLVLRRRGIRGSVSASITGPTDRSPAEPAVFHALPCCGGAPGRYHWRQRGWCRGMPCGAWQDVGDGDSVSTAFTGDSEVELSVLSPFGDADTSIMFVRVGNPFLVIEGPNRVARGTAATWTVRLTASAPWVVNMYRQWLAPGGRFENLGSRTSVTFPVTAPVRISAKLNDGLGRSADAQLDVEMFIDNPPPLSSKPVRLTQRMDGSGRAETLAEVARATTLRVAVYDLHGRERVLLLNDAQPSGARMIRWDTHVLEQGVYFLRAVTSAGEKADLRFLVIR